MTPRIQNLPELATTPLRRKALDIIEKGLGAIDTASVVRSSVRLEGERLLIKDTAVDLSRFKRIRVIGFGKASCDAAVALEGILGERIAGGIVVSTTGGTCQFLEHAVGSHPRPSTESVQAGQRVVQLAQDTRPDDLVIVIVSGGGSSLLCWPESECGYGQKVYDAMTAQGATIPELNTVRKHISLLKGGGLAKLFHPARIVGLIFSDIPGDRYELVASGPTYKDNTTPADAAAILEKYGISGIELTETVREDKYFENVTNIPLISNTVALEAMLRRAKELGFSGTILSAALYDHPRKIIRDMAVALKDAQIVIGGGEASFKIEGPAGKGGRNTYLALYALGALGPDDLFAAVASDGMDNSDAAGALADHLVVKGAASLQLDAGEYIRRYDGYTFFEKAGGLIRTGPTGANTADLVLWLRENPAP